MASLLGASSLLLRPELRGDRRQEPREGAERRAALDVEAYGLRQPVGEARPQARALTFGLESVVARLQGVAEPIQVVGVRVVVDELRGPLDLRARRAVGRARTQGRAAPRRVDHALDRPRFAARHEVAADERVLQPVTLLAFDMADSHALV